jgi:hypothetical protein
MRYIMLLVTLTLLMGGLYYVTNHTDLLHVRAGRAEEVQQWTEQINTEVLANLRNVESIQFDTSVLQTVQYTALTDTRIELRDANTSRPNPFNPVVVTQQSL